MARFKPILMEKITREEQAEKEQQELKDTYGIADASVSVRKKGIQDYGISAIKGLGYLLYVILVFLGIVIWINPTSREILLGLVGFGG